ncbi:hypothetical protein D3Y59_01705 [Hymenobacter oligotrophus]|uniref:Transposase IS200-like domain-containing protein n=1 Tax=Hymenobacter oligotrophus TaxID=2319843 RepID=A0A3B7QVQ3_9BACT|nr:transposase [Hymenobacter oligotrophus]AYA35874.1 hypothetical protein D3Y59_01705 [Hymenobacter oligotrophus]
MAELIYYERNLSHRLPPGEAIFLTFRLAGSSPKVALEKLKAEQELANRQAAETDIHTYALQKRYFARFDAILDEARFGPQWLREPTVAAVVQAAIHHYHTRAYELVCYCLMPNHVHLLVALPSDAPPLIRTLQHLKGYTAQQANRILQRTGQFWQRETYDHVVRNAGEMQRIVAYVLQYPVKAGLVTEWQQWPYSYWAP